MELPDFSFDWRPVASVIAVVLPGFALVVILSRTLGRLLTRHGSEHSGLIVQRFVLWGGTLALALGSLSLFGFDITGLLATAGVATVAIGFAAQTTLSNFISGLFLIGEKPFRIGDLIRVGERLGVVTSIDMLSVKLRTLDNLFVRIPNEEMIKRELVNVTRYPIRRMDVDVRVAYRSDLDRVEAILREIARDNPFALEDPEPLVLVKDFAPNEIVLLWGVWFEKNDYVNLRNSLLRTLKDRLTQEGIEIPFPQLRVHTPASPVGVEIKAPDGRE